jgi:hypothetical protein
MQFFLYPEQLHLVVYGYSIRNVIISTEPPCQGEQKHQRRARQRAS